MKRQRIRSGITFISLLLFPVTLNYFSPYVSIHGAMNGIISGSLLLFISLFLISIFFGRAWCSWVCPMAALSDYSLRINNRTVNVQLLKKIRYTIFTIWASILVLMFVLAGGIRAVNPLHLTEQVVSVDMPLKYVIYYSVLGIFVILTFTVGKRGACHSICWMSPFMVAGYHVGNLLKVPQLRIHSEPSKCVSCGRCNQKCPMSIDVQSNAKLPHIETSDCILCGECIDTCPKKVLSYHIRH